MFSSQLNAFITLALLGLIAVSTVAAVIYRFGKSE